MLKVLIPATVIMIILAIVAGIFANKAGNKKPASSEDFQVAATTAVNGSYNENANIAVSVLSQLENKKMFKDVIVCPIDENNSVYFYAFKNKGDAKSFFAGNARKLKEATVNTIDDKQENLENYSYYKASADDRYVAIVRVNKTVLYADVKKEHKDKIETIIESLNY